MKIDFIGISHPYLCPIEDVKIYAKGNYDMLYIHHPDGFIKGEETLAYVHHYHLKINDDTLDKVEGWKKMIGFDKIPHITTTLDVPVRESEPKEDVRLMDLEWHLA